MRARRDLLILLLLLLILAGSGAGGQRDPVLEGFVSPPASSRIRLFWRVFGPAWTPSEIDRQLLEIKRAGVGGVMTNFTYPLSADDPTTGIHNQTYLSAEFLKTLSYASSAAKRLGLDFGLFGGTGWPFGGPTVELRDSAQRIRSIRPPPLPDGSGWKLPALRDGERILAAFVEERDVSPRTYTEIPVVTKGGVLARALDRPQSSIPEATVLIVGPTFMQVKRPALGAEGYVVDHYNRDAVARYLDSAVAPLIDAAPADAPVRTLFCDSLEVYNSNWTDSLPAEFRRRRGYALIPHLPALFDPKAADAPAIRFDFWRTLSELAEENFVRTVYDWCRKRSVKFAIEPYGTPPLGLAAAVYCDSPWGEQYEYRGFSFSRFAASAGHLAGKRIIGAEAWTWTGIPNRLVDTLADLKLCSDMHFLAGENELTGVDYAYTPAAAGVPGWMPYFGPVLNSNNPQWPLFHELADYVSRCQWILRQGRPVADVALYLPVEDCYAEGPTAQMPLDFQLRDRLATVKTDEFGLQKALKHYSDVIDGIQRAGLNFDGIDFSAMNSLAKVSGPRLTAGDGQYSVVILPDVAIIEIGALERIADFCRAGGVAIAVGRLPDRPAGLRSDADMRRFRALILELWGVQSVASGDARMHPVREGGTFHTIMSASAVANALNHVGTDLVEIDEDGTPTNVPVYHVHRRTEDCNFYFIARLPHQSKSLRIVLQVRGSASLWNPMTGTIQRIPTEYLGPRLPMEVGDHRNQVIRLNDFGSGVICIERNGRNRKPAGSEPRIASSEVIVPITPVWTISLEGPDAPPVHTTSKLESWTEWPGGRNFSGRGIYRATIRADHKMRKGCRLQFEQVHEAAEVFVNGKRAGSVWCEPYAVEIGRWLKAGDNRLEVRVYNVLANRVLGLPDPDLKALRATFGVRFPDPQEKKLMANPAPSGLIGKITIITKK